MRALGIVIIAMLSISLIASFITIRPALALNSFSDGFESGSFSAWTGTATKTALDTCTIDHTITFSGAYSGKFTTISNGASTEHADCYIAINNSNLVYARGYFYFGPNTLPLDDNSDRFTIIQLGWTGGDRIGSVQIEKSSGVPTWAVRIYVGATVATYRSATPVPLNQCWWEVQFMEKVDTTLGEVHLWVNGSEIISHKSLNTTTLGQINKVHFGSPYTMNVQHDVTVYADNCKVSDSYIQPEPVQPPTGQYGLFVGVSGSGTTNATGITMYNANTAVAVNATPAAGWVLNNWFLNGSNVGSTNPYVLTMTQNYNLTVAFLLADQGSCAISVPTSLVQMQVANGTLSYFNTLLSNVPPGYDVTNGYYLGWCVDLRYSIARSPTVHNVMLYSSCDPPADLMNQRWDLVNYILNHKQGSASDIQQAISYFIKLNGQPIGWQSGYTPTAEAQAMVNDALANGTGYLPSPSNVIAVICRPQEATQITIIEVRVPSPHQYVVPSLYVTPPVTKFFGPCLVSTYFQIDVILWNNPLSGQDVYAFDFSIDWSSIPAGYISLVNATAHSPWDDFLTIANSNVTADNNPITNWHLAITAVPPSTGLTNVNESVLTLVFHIDKDVCWPNSVTGTFALLNVKMSGDGTEAVIITKMEIDNGSYQQFSVQPDIELVTTDAAYNATTNTITEKCNSHTFDIEVDLTNITNMYGFEFTVIYNSKELETDAQHITFKAAFPPPYEVLMVHQDTDSLYIKLVRPSEKPTVCGTNVPAVDIVFHTSNTKDFASGEPLFPTTDNSTINITQATIYEKCPDPISTSPVIGPSINYVFKPSKYDLNLDCSVDVQDMMVLLPKYGTTALSGGYGDLALPNLSVDIFDFVAIAKHLGPVDP